jgi:thiamine kinase-like enzyme
MCKNNLLVNQKVPIEIIKFVQKSLNTKNINLIYRDFGFKNEIYIFESMGKKYVVKSSILLDGIIEKKNEVIILNLLKSKEIPKLVAIDLEKGLLMRTFFEGKHKQKLTLNEIKIAAKKLNKLHSFKSKKIIKLKNKKNYKQYFYSEIDLLKQNLFEISINSNSKLFVDEMQHLLKKALKDEEKTILKFRGNKFSIIIRDLFPKNVVWDKDLPIVIDWGDAGLGDPAFVISRMVFGFGFNKKQKQLFLDEYNSKDKNLSIRLKTYSRFVRLIGLVYVGLLYYFVQSGKIKSTKIGNLNTFSKLIIERYVGYMSDYHSKK